MNYKKEIKISLLVLFVTYSLVVLFGVNNIFISGDCVAVHGGIFSRCLGIALFPDKFQSISFFLFFLLPFLSLLFFTKEAVYLAWRKFVLWYFPTVALILLFSPASEGNGLMSIGVGGDRESLTFFFSGLFAIISLFLIIYKSIKLRGK